MTDNELPSARWSVEQRQAFIDRRLYWDGQINRSDLINHYSISTPQASADLALYSGSAQGNMAYDARAKTYVATATFQPRTPPSARQYLAQLQLLADDVLQQSESWLGWMPPFGIVPRVRRKLEAAVLRTMLDSIHNGRGIQVRYQSMNSDDSSVRWIVPHALGFDGQRWHTRAWCHRREKFLDFVLARVLSVLDVRSDKIDAQSDAAWNKTTLMRIGPNPALPKSQRQAIALDYGMSNGEASIEVRLSLVYYLARQMLLDLTHLLPPERAQLTLLNLDEVNQALEEVGESTLPNMPIASAASPAE